MHSYTNFELDIFRNVYFLYNGFLLVIYSVMIVDRLSFLRLGNLLIHVMELVWVR